ncbi:MAG: hypothetical protein V3W34_01120 [Phycisphaerae bacterium]
MDDAGEAFETQYAQSIPAIGDWTGDGLDDPAKFRVNTWDWPFTDRVRKGGSLVCRSRRLWRHQDAGSGLAGVGSGLECGVA